MINVCDLAIFRFLLGTYFRESRKVTKPCRTEYTLVYFRVGLVYFSTLYFSLGF